MGRISSTLWPSSLSRRSPWELSVLVRTWNPRGSIWVPDLFKSLHKWSHWYRWIKVKYLRITLCFLSAANGAQMKGGWVMSKECRVGESQRNLIMFFSLPPKFFFSLQGETSHKKIRENERDRREREIENNRVWRRKQDQSRNVFFHA